MLNSQRLAVRSSELREKLNTLSGLDTLNDEQRAELDTTTKEFKDTELQYRAALLSEGEEEQRAKESEPDAEHRERLALRSKASVTDYILSAIQGTALTGAAAEYRAAEGIADGIPMELFDTAETEQRADAPTPAPGTVGVNLDTFRPFVFSRSVLPALGVEMPRVMSGTYASATISTTQTAKSYAEGVDADSAAAGFTVTSVTPKRISARMSIRIEDVAQVGQANFESALRQNIMLALSNELDDQGLNGAGGNSGADLIGIFERLTDPAATTGVADFNGFAASFGNLVDGLWANTIKDVMIVVGPATYQLATRAFQTTTGSAGEMSAAAYSMMQTGGFWTNSRMPAAGTFESIANVQQAIGYRKNSMIVGGGMGMRTAVCPRWNYIGIDDIYTGSGER